MAGEKYRPRIEELLAHAGVVLNGSNPWDIQVHNEALYPRVFAEGSLGLGEAYMDGWWDSERLDECFCRLMGADLGTRLRPWKDTIRRTQARLTNRQNRTRAYQVGKRHYDAGNDLYARMLDQRMIYSCGYWQGATCLDEAQEAKLDLICRKLDLRPGMRVLDIGCGWGGAARFLAERCGASVVGVTISGEQARFARESCRGLPIDIRMQDYRQLDEPFDRVLSVGMFEHVGLKNYRTFMEVARRCLAADGLFLLHTIGGNRSVVRTDSWIDRYIFPNAMLPSASQVTTAAEGLFVLEDWHNFGADYDRTLMEWFRNFEEAWPELQEKYGEGFYRMWKYYLLSCAGTFRARLNQLWQIVFSPKGMPDGFRVRG